MTKKKQAARAELRKAADELVNEILSGKWDHIQGLSTRPMDELTEIFEALENRCPGYTQEAYKETFLRSHWENR